MDLIQRPRRLRGSENLRKMARETRMDKGIGTLSEKTLHAVLKMYYEPDEDNHEVAIDGYFADIYNEHGIIEIQTRQLNKLRDKLSVFLNEYQVRVVYPMPYEKYLSWIEPETGDITSRRKSPKRCSMYDAMFELYKIKAFLKNQNLKVTLLLIDMEEYKLLNGWSYDKKRGSVRYDRIPVGIRKIVELDCPQDYMHIDRFFQQRNICLHSLYLINYCIALRLFITILVIINICNNTVSPAFNL